MTHPTVTQALSPCEFCDGENVHLRQAQQRLGRYVECDGCEARGPVMYSKNAAIAAWNTRATEASTAARIAALEAEKAQLREALDWMLPLFERVDTQDEPITQNDLPRGKLCAAFRAHSLTATEGEG